MPEPNLRLRPKPDPGEIARFRRAILKAWHSHLLKIEKPTTKKLATEEFCQLVNSGLLVPEPFPKPMHVSKSTLYGWKKVYEKHGLGALVPMWMYKWKKKRADGIIPLLPSYRKITIPGTPRLIFKEDWRWEIRKRWRCAPLRGPVMLVIFFYMAVPEGTSMNRRMRMLNRDLAHFRPPHVESLMAFVKDCLKGIVYTEGRQIISLGGEKHYAWSPKTEIYIRRLKG